MALASSKRFARFQQKVKETFLPDTCRIYPPTREISDSGTYTEGLGDALLYEGSQDIPCWIDESKYFGEEDIYEQEVTASQYQIHVPADCTLYADHIIESNGHIYQIRRLMTEMDYKVTNSALVSELSAGE